VTIFPLPEADFKATPAVADILNSTVDVIDLSSDDATVHYTISDGSVYGNGNFSHRFLDSGTFRITQIAVTDENCTDTFASTVRINFIFTFFMPNTVTPNGDGRNDVLRPQGMGIVKYDLIVFNRWGEVLFQSDKDRDEWDPREVMDGVYFYRINVIDHENKPHSYTGSVHVIR
jgi:gliding motility-associated-like protein